VGRQTQDLFDVVESHEPALVRAQQGRPDDTPGQSRGQRGQPLRVESNRAAVGCRFDCRERLAGQLVEQCRLVAQHERLPRENRRDVCVQMVRERRQEVMANPVARNRQIVVGGIVSVRLTRLGEPRDQIPVTDVEQGADEDAACRLNPRKTRRAGAAQRAEQKRLGLIVYLARRAATSIDTCPSRARAATSSEPTSTGTSRRSPSSRQNRWSPSLSLPRSW
jgi:hypothetical protein